MAGQILTVQSKLQGGRSRGGFTFPDSEPGVLVKVTDVEGGLFTGTAAPVGSDGRPAGDGVINDGRHRVSTVTVRIDDEITVYQMVEMNAADFAAVKADPFLQKAQSIPASAVAPPAAAAAAAAPAVAAKAPPAL